LSVPRAEYSLLFSSFCNLHFSARVLNISSKLAYTSEGSDCTFSTKLIGYTISDYVRREQARVGRRVYQTPCRSSPTEYGRNGGHDGGTSSITRERSGASQETILNRAQVVHVAFSCQAHFWTTLLDDVDDDKNDKELTNKFFDSI